MKSILCAWVVLPILCLASSDDVIVFHTKTEPIIDGELDGCWEKAQWVTLDDSRPGIPQTEEKWQDLSNMLGNYIRTQFAQKVRVASLWSDRGLFVAFYVEDTDIIGRMKDGEYLWLEDVVEIFLAQEVRADAKYAEIQLNPANAVLVNGPLSRPQTGVKVVGTLNNSAEKDTCWTAEFFFSWDDLEQHGLIRRPGIRNTTIGAVRFASWDLTTYTQLRLNRFTSPGTAEPHFPEHYRKIICR